MKNMFKQSKHLLGTNTGFSLVETLVAIGIMTAVVSGIMALVYQGSVASRYQADQITATYLAADAVEYIRSERDSYWLEDPVGNEFASWSQTINNECYDVCTIDTRIGEESIDWCDGSCPPLDYNESTGFYGYGNGNASRFTRSIDIDAASDSLEMAVTVSWPRNNFTESVTIEQSIYDYRDSN
jgi:type II secretory pathway pseudopilin PulG